MRIGWDDGRRVISSAGRRFREALVSLPLILTLASLALVLEQLHTFQAFDDAMLSLVSQLKPRAPMASAPTGELVTVMVSRQMFESELNRQLPIDKTALSRVLKTLGDQSPRVLAIDVDAIPMEAPASAPQSEGPPMRAAIVDLLRRGIDVVAVSYPRRTKESAEQAREWRRQYCQAAESIQATDDGTRKGKLYWASAWLQSEGRGNSVLRHFGPEDAGRLAQANESLLPVGLVLSAAAGLAGKHQATLAPLVIGYCDTLLSDAVQTRATTASPEDSREDAQEETPQPSAFINYFGPSPLELEIASSNELTQRGSELKGKAVMLGVNSFEKVDTHMTPLGQLPGAVVHTLVAASVGAPLHAGHFEAFLLDIAAGYLFVVIFLSLRDGSRALEQHAPHARTLLRVLSMATPLIPLFVTAVCVLLFMPQLTSHGLWLNPLPVVVGLLIHLYAELTEREEHHHPAHAADHGRGLSAALAQWRRQWRDQWHRLAAWRRHLLAAPTLMRFDFGLWLTVRVVSLALIAGALHILITSH